MNAVTELVASLPRAALQRLLRAARPRARLRGQSSAKLRADLIAEFELDLVGFINLANRSELDEIARARRLSAAGHIGELRARLWLHGAECEAGSSALDPVVQPVPIVLRGKLVHLRAGVGRAPPATVLPRRVGPPRQLPVVDHEPDTVEELLAAADALVDVRLGASARDKGAFGMMVADLLGVAEGGFAEPDWRGEVEIKTVPVILDRAGWWRVKEDPAIAMEGVSPVAKLRRVLWIARVADRDDSPVLSWYYQEWSAEVAELASRYLHTRPKGGAGATSRGWYLHKSFFIESGFLHSLNG